MIVCALPYSRSVTYERNSKISEMNSALYNVTAYSDKMHFFDLNKFCKSVRFHKNRVSIAKRCKVAIAKLLAYNVEPGYGDSATGSGGAADARASSPAGRDLPLN